MLSVSGGSGGDSGAAGNRSGCSATTPLLPGPPVPPIQGGAARLPPKFTISGPASQRLERRHLSVLAQCDEPCTATGWASVSVRQASKLLRTKKATRAVAAGAQGKLKLKFSK